MINVPIELAVEGSAVTIELPQTAKNALVVLLPQGAELPQTAKLPFTNALLPHTAKLLQIEELPHTAKLSLIS